MLGVAPFSLSRKIGMFDAAPKTPSAPAKLSAIVGLPVTPAGVIGVAAFVCAST